jgi:hypothetical protein
MCTEGAAAIAARIASTISGRLGKVRNALDEFHQKSGRGSGTGNASGVVA